MDETYCIGHIFKDFFKRYKRVMLCQVGLSVVILINLENGNRLTEIFGAEDPMMVPLDKIKCAINDSFEEGWEDAVLKK